MSRSRSGSPPRRRRPSRSLSPRRASDDDDEVDVGTNDKYYHRRSTSSERDDAGREEGTEADKVGDPMTVDTERDPTVGSPLESAPTTNGDQNVHDVGGPEEREEKKKCANENGTEDCDTKKWEQTGDEKSSRKDCRVYVGNLSYQTRPSDLRRFMSEAGKIVFADVLTSATGVSKGCGVVEYSTAEEARKAIRELTEKNLMGRPVFVREDREDSAKYGYNRATGNSQIFVSNIPFSVTWTHLKDLFRDAGLAVVRADIMMLPNGRPKGNGTVLFESPEDAKKAIAKFDGYEWMERKIEVREDRYPEMPLRPPPRHLMRHPPPPPLYGRPGRYGGGGYGYGGYYGGGGGGGGGFHGGYGYGDPYYDSYGGGYGGYYGGGGSGTGSGGGGGGYGHRGGSDIAGLQIFVGNLPYTTTNQDLKDLFRSCGNIVYAEALELPNGRPKGSAIVRFDTYDSAERACAKFHGYVYGGRSIEVRMDRHI